MFSWLFKKKPAKSQPEVVKESKLIEVQVPAHSLEIGMHVTRLDRPWTDVPVLIQGLTIQSPNDLEIIRNHCDYVYIELEQAFWKESLQYSIVPENQGFKETRDVHEELPRAKNTIEKTLTHVESVFNDVNNGEIFDFEESRLVVRSCIKSIMSNANALLWLTKIKRQDNYTAEHSMRVGILAIAFGRFMGLKEEELELIGLCGMLHDVGKIRIPDEVLNKPGRLTEDEYEVMKLHTVHGKEILDALQNVDQLIKDTAYFHHERIDGLGYPEKIKAGSLHRYIRMVSIVDVYDAITSARPYKDGTSAFEAMKILFAEVDKHFDKELVEAFIRMIGIYPTGTLVEMTNGEVGIVISANPQARLRPKVELVMNSDRTLRSPYVVNLASGASDENGEPYVIKEGLANRTYGINVKDYILK